MPRPAWNRLSPWIERLILSYGSRNEEEVGGRLKAYVIGVGQMSQSQAGTSAGPTGLLFLSDGVLQLPATLTASAWEHLQEKEDRECFTSLLNSTVCIQDYRLQFHMAVEQTKCRFFLSVGLLATTAAGPINDNTPCCTSLPSVRMKICQTWGALLGQEDSQKSQCGFDLSELLGEWQHDCLQAVLEDIREKLTIARERPASPQPSTSTCCSTLTYPATGWDVDRIRHKGAKRFSVPMKYLLIPEEGAQQVQTLKNAASSTERMEKETLAEGCKPPAATQPSVDDAHWQIAQPAAIAGVCAASDSSPLPIEDSVLHEDVIAGGTDGPLSNPWDMFSPPCISSSSSDVSPEKTPSVSLQPGAGSRPDPATSTQLPGHLVESSYFPPYQKHPTPLPATATSSSSASTPMIPAGEAQHCTLTAQQSLPSLNRESEQMVVRRHRKVKRKQSEPPTEALSTVVEDKEGQLGSSPPSWLFDTQAGGSRTEGGSSPKRATGSVPRTAPKVHGDGSPFSYSYRVSGQNLQDLSRFRVAESLLHWAVKSLVTPKQTDNPADVA